MKESRITRACLAELNSLEGCYAYRNNTGAVMIGKRPVRFGDPGSGDIIGAFLGRAIAIENKTRRGKQSDVQRRWQEKWEAAGGLYILARSVAEMRVSLGVKPDHPRKPIRDRIIHR